jgi:hypothetical protein
MQLKNSMRRTVFGDMRTRSHVRSWITRAELAAYLLMGIGEWY